MNEDGNLLRSKAMIKQQETEVIKFAASSEHSFYPQQRDCQFMQPPLEGNSKPRSHLGEGQVSPDGQQMMGASVAGPLKILSLFNQSCSSHVYVLKQRPCSKRSLSTRKKRRIRGEKQMKRKKLKRSCKFHAYLLSYGAA